VLHPITLAEGSRTALAMNTTEVTGASFHHQGLDPIGNGLKVVGHSPDGVIEALEHADRWLVAVQWHPEDTAATDHHQQSLYDSLIAQARSARLVG
jgi:putative glutamine amidotransferase